MTKAAELANLIGNINAGGGGVNRNLIINGSMDVAQRGTSATNPGGGYATVDRYRHSQNSSGLGNFTSEQVTDAPDGSGLTKSFKFTKSGATTMGSGQSAFIEQYIEEKNCQILEYGTSDAKTTTLSFYVKSSLTGTFGVSLARLDSGGSFTHSHVKTYTISSANTWEYKSVTITGNTSQNLVGITSLNVRFCLGAGTDRQATADTWHSSDEHTTSAQTQLPQTDGATWQLTGVQLEVGQNPTEFEHEPFERTLAKCQRYFQLTQPNFYHSLAPMLDGASDLRGYVKFPVTMRATPTLTLDVGSGTITTNHNGIDGFNMVGTSTSTIHFLNDYTADAEL
jgi:hypothetical protein